MKANRIGSLNCLVMVFAFTITISLVGCASITLIAPYDQKIDEGVTNLQKMSAEFFTKIERQGGSKPEDYKNHSNFYDDSKVALSGILVRADAIATNTKTVDMLRKLNEQLQLLEARHQKDGISAAVATDNAKSFNRTFGAILTLEVAKKEL